MPAAESRCASEWNMATRARRIRPRPEREGMRARNLLGQLNRHHDEAGLTAVSSVDFKGNVLEKLRQVIADEPILAVFEQAAANGWRVTPFQADWETRPGQTLAERERELLDSLRLSDHVELRRSQPRHAAAASG